MICTACAAWIAPIIDRAAHTLRCPECGFVEGYRPFPLFIVTGASGTGKSAVIPALRPLLPAWEIFETDILWDSGGNWDFVRNNWLRIAHSIAASGRPTLLCGTLVPETVDRCDHRHYFDPIHYLALHCHARTLEARLRARPAWRNHMEAFIAGQRELSAWLLRNATTAFDPPLVLLDTTDAPISDTAEQIRDWAASRWAPSG